MKKFNSVPPKTSAQRKYQDVGEGPSMETAIETERVSTSYTKKWCVYFLPGEKNSF